MIDLRYSFAVVHVFTANQVQILKKVGKVEEPKPTKQQQKEKKELKLDIDVGSEVLKRRTVKSVRLFSRKRGFSSHDQLARFTNLAVSTLGMQADDHSLLKCIIDYQSEITLQFTVVLAICYIGFYLLPFYAQMLTENKTLIITFNSLCATTLLVLGYFEVLQMKAQGLDYLSYPLSYLKIAQTVIFGIYMYLRIQHYHVLLPPEEEVDPWLVALNCLLSVFGFIRIIVIFRGSSTLAQMLLIISNIIKDLAPFNIILTSFIAQTAIMYELVGASVYNRDVDFKHEKGVPDLAKQMLVQFKSSLGNMSLPRFGGDQQNYFALLWVYVVFLVGQFLMLVVLMNYLIVLIFQSYDNSLGPKQTQYLYKMKADLNCEIMPLVDRFTRAKKEESQVIYIKAPLDVQLTSP